MDNLLIGRKKEQKKIIEYLNSPQNEFVAIYGRRRVGKTYLVKNVLGDNLDFWFTGLYQKSQKIQLEYFKMELIKKNPLLKMAKIDSWRNAFYYLSEYLHSLNKNRVIIFLDEIPWMDTHKGDFLTALSYFWNMWNSNIILKLYVCGSSTSWMIDKLIGDKGGLYARVGEKIYLAPFTLSETEQYLNTIKKAHYNKQQVLDTYMVLGGIPFYLNMIDPSLPLAKNINELFFRINGELRGEFDFVFRSLFNDSQSYQKVILALSKKHCGLTREEILLTTKVSGGPLTTILKNLRSCDFVRCYSSFEKKNKEKIYQLIDPFTLFYLSFVKDDDGQNPDFWTINHNKPIINSWSGYAYEIVCLLHSEQIKKSLGISGIDCTICSWKTNSYQDDNGITWPKAQIDMVIDRDDNVINLIEIKYNSKEKYIITNKYDELVNNRIQNFKVATKTKKSLICTYITTLGLEDNQYSRDVISRIDLEDLFLD